MLKIDVYNILYSHFFAKNVVILGIIEKFGNLIGVKHLTNFTSEFSQVRLVVDCALKTRIF